MIVITPPHPTPPNKERQRKKTQKNLGRFSGRRQIQGIPQEYTTHVVIMEMGGVEGGKCNLHLLSPPRFFGGTTICLYACGVNCFFIFIFFHEGDDLLTKKTWAYQIFILRDAGRFFKKLSI